MRNKHSQFIISKAQQIKQHRIKENLAPVPKFFSSSPKNVQKTVSIRYPKEVSKYQVICTLGLGSFGKVQQVLSPRGQVLALKQISKSQITSSKQQQNIKRQTQILNQLTHPFIYSLKTTFQDKDFYYMLLQFCPGGQLFAQLRKQGKFTNNATVFYISEIILSICYIHSKNVVYRDLKPQNILIDGEGHVKLADFGFAKRLGSSRTFTLCGTPEYLAPEIVMGQKQGYGRSVDWWALGILIYELLTGTPPFFDISPLQIYSKILQGKIHFPSNLNSQAKDIIRGLLKTDAQCRLGSHDNGVSIKNHEWLRGVSWKGVFQRETLPPWTPRLRNSLDVRYFKKAEESGWLLLKSKQQSLLQ